MRFTLKKETTTIHMSARTHRPDCGNCRIRGGNIRAGMLLKWLYMLLLLVWQREHEHSAPVKGDKVRDCRHCACSGENLTENRTDERTCKLAHLFDCSGELTGEALTMMNQKPSFVR